MITDAADGGGLAPGEPTPWAAIGVAPTFAELEAEARAAADVDPEAKHELAYLTPELIADAATTRRNLAAQEAEAMRSLTPDELTDLAAIDPAAWRAYVEAEKVRLGLTLAETLDVIDPVGGEAKTEPAPSADPRTGGHPLEPPAHLVRQSRAAWYFAKIAGDRVRFDHGRGRWLIWSGHRWQPDEDGSVHRMWLGVLATRYGRALGAADRERARLTAEVQAAGAMNSAITAGLSIASSMEPIATTADAWDTDPWLLCCENGVVELRTGHLRPGRPDEMISRSTGIAYEPDAPCPRWLRFLEEVFAGDQELVDWYGLLVGTSLVGVVLELLAIHHGLGNNGKSVAVRAQRRAFGDYAVVIPVETLVSAKRTAGEATPDLMALRGARIAYTSEPDQAAKLRGGVLKRLASIDRMTGRPLYGTTQTWEPTHTVHLATNHLPAVDDATEGFWRRVALVPWNVHFRKPGEDGDAPPEDPDLAATLATESAGILAWAVRGAVAYAAGATLHPFPAAVRVKTDAYRTDEDKLGTFVADCAVYEQGASIGVSVLFAAYRNWCETESVPPADRLGRKQFANGFAERGRVERVKDVTNRWVFSGARLSLSTDPGLPDFQTPFAGTPYTSSESGKSGSSPSKVRKSGTSDDPVDAAIPPTRAPGAGVVP
jgi:P4 family phage/plasmid primase-like protien